MHFLILTQYFPPEIGASSTRLLSVAREIIAAGHSVDVVTSMPNYPTGKIFPGYQGSFYRRECCEAITVHRVWAYPSMGSGFARVINYASFAVNSLFALLRARKPDYIFVESPPISTLVPGSIAAKIMRIPFIFNVADLWPDSVKALGLMSGSTLRMFVWVSEILERYAYRKATFVTAVTQGILETLTGEKGVPPRKALYLPNGVDTNLFSPRPPDDELKTTLGLEGKRIVIYPGTIGYAHGLDTLVDAAQLLMLSDPDVHFLLIGDGSERTRIMEQVTARRVNNVTLLSPVPVSELPRYISLSACGLVTLRDGIALLASARPAKTLGILACGKPVIFCGGVDFPKLIEDHKMGIAVPQNNPSRLAESIRMLVRDEPTLVEFGINARRYMVANCGWPGLVNRWLQHLGGERAGANTPLLPAEGQSTS